MGNKKETNLGEYFIAAFLGGFLTGPGGLFLSPMIFFLISGSKGILTLIVNGHCGLSLVYYPLLLLFTVLLSFQELIHIQKRLRKL